MLVTNAFGLGGEGFDPGRECPFEDVEPVEVVVDDPWFADVDAALDVLGDVDSGVLERLVGLCPDASVVARLAAVDRSCLSPQDGVAFTVVVERVIGWLAAVQDEAILAAGSGHTQVQEVLVADRGPDRFGQRALRIEDAIREELAAATRWSLGHAHDREYQHEPKPISTRAQRESAAIDRALARHGITLPPPPDTDDPPF